MARIGYARVSSADPDAEAEIEALNNSGVERMFIDRPVRRTDFSHPELAACLAHLHRGDQLVVLKTDRLGGIVPSLYWMNLLNRVGVQVESLTEPSDRINTKKGLLKCRLTDKFTKIKACAASFLKSLIAIIGIFLPSTMRGLSISAAVIWASFLSIAPTLANVILLFVIFIFPRFQRLVLSARSVVREMRRSDAMTEAAVSRPRASRDDESWMLMGSMALAVIGGFALAYIAAYLTVIAANGAVSTTSFYYPGTVIGSLQLLIVYSTVGLLIGVPHKAFKRGLDRNGNGDARRVLVTLITIGACALTVTYLVLAHLDGPLKIVQKGPLAVGILFTIALIAPYYRALVLACWQRGIGGIFNWRTALKSWRNAAREVRKLPKQADEAGNLSVGSDSKSSETAD